MTQTDTQRAGEPDTVPLSTRRSFWGAVMANGVYGSATGLLFKSQRRQFLLLASVPVLWILFANVGPILQMVRISFLDSYPPMAGYQPQLTLRNWNNFFAESIFIVPYFRTLAYSVVFTVATLIITYPVAYFLAKHVKRGNRAHLCDHDPARQQWCGEPRA